jgi:hypothetical protein
LAPVISFWYCAGSLAQELLLNTIGHSAVPGDMLVVNQSATSWIL